MISKKIGYPTDDIWRTRLRDLPGFRAFRVKFWRVCILTYRGIFDNQLRASALTYYSILSVVPVLALLFGIARGFGYEALLQRQLQERLPGQQEVAAKITAFAHSLLQHTQGGLIAGVGVVFLFYSVVNVLMSIENNFNQIWRVQEGRPFKRKVNDYLSFMLIAPVLFITASGLTVFITAEVRTIVEGIEILGTVSPAIFFLLKLSPFVTIWLLFTFMYIFMPNAKVRFLPGALAALIAGSIFQLFQWFYISFQIGVSRYNAIYGSFAALPIFLIWLQLSWVITLVGAEIAYALQHADLYDYESDCKTVSRSFKRLLSLRVVHLLVHGFSKGESSPGERKLVEKIGCPPLLLREVLDELLQANIISRIKANADGEETYQPARRAEKLTAKYVIELLERQGSDEIPIDRSEELEKISETLTAFSELIENSPANRPLVEI